MDLNKVMLIGNATREPELKTTATAQNVCSFSVATNQNWTDAQGVKQKRAEYHNIVAWGNLAEICSKFIVKGMKIYIEGRLQTREWTTPDSQKRVRTEIVATDMILLERKHDVSVQAQQSVTGPASDQEIRLEDIPF